MNQAVALALAAAIGLAGCKAIDPFEPACTASDAATILGAWLAASEAACVEHECSTCNVESCPPLADIDAEYQRRMQSWVDCGGEP